MCSAASVLKCVHEESHCSFLGAVVSLTQALPEYVRPAANASDKPIRFLR